MLKKQLDGLRSCLCPSGGSKQATLSGQTKLMDDFKCQSQGGHCDVLTEEIPGDPRVIVETCGSIFRMFHLGSVMGAKLPKKDCKMVWLKESLPRPMSSADFLRSFPLWCVQLKLCEYGIFVGYGKTFLKCGNVISFREQSDMLLRDIR